MCNHIEFYQSLSIFFLNYTTENSCKLNHAFFYRPQGSRHYLGSQPACQLLANPLPSSPWPPGNRHFDPSRHKIFLYETYQKNGAKDQGTPWGWPCNWYLFLKHFWYQLNQEHTMMYFWMLFKAESKWQSMERYNNENKNEKTTRENDGKPTNNHNITTTIMPIMIMMVQEPPFL